MYVGKITLSFKINFEKKQLTNLTKIEKIAWYPCKRRGSLFQIVTFFNEIGELYFFIHLIVMHNLNYTIKELKNISID